MNELLSAVREAHGGLESGIPAGWGKLRSKTVTWNDPATLAAGAGALPGREFLRAIIDGRLPPPPIANLIGARLVSVDDGEAVFRCARLWLR